MREKRLIKEGSPCIIDFTDKSIQSASDVAKKGMVVCSNFRKCKNGSREISCFLKAAQLMAAGIIGNEGGSWEIVENEKNAFLNFCPQNRFWVRRKKEWSIVEGKENVVDDIVAFAFIILDLKPGDRGLSANAVFESVERHDKERLKHLSE